MIITQTPLRISFFGGGTDFSSYYRREPGWVVSSAIDEYIFVIIKERFDDKIRVGYTRTELVDDIDEIEHELVRECLRRTGIRKGIEISTMGDIPAEGSGLGSSSTVTVGLLNAMYVFTGKPKEQARLAREACEIEIDVLGKPIGKQDQYIAAFGGQRMITFCPDDNVDVEPLDLDTNLVRGLNQNLLLFYTNHARKAESVLGEQVQNIPDRMGVLGQLKQMALQAREFLRTGQLDAFGELLHEGWLLKQQMASKITNGYIDGLYTAARQAGALGGKLVGAGGGGYLLLYCPSHHQNRVRDALGHLPELSFRLERDGTKVIFDCRR